MDKISVVQKAISGDENALKTLYSLYWNKVYFRCYNLLENKNDAEDMTQEAFLKMMKSIHTLNDCSKFESWLMTIATNCCKSYMRKKKPIVLNDENPDAFFEKFSDESSLVNPEQSVLEYERNNIIKSTLKHLPKEQQEAILYYYFDEISIKEIASKMNCTEHCVRGRIKLARKRILKQMSVLEKKDKSTYLGTFVVFGNLLKSASYKITASALSSIGAKILAVIMSLAVVGLGAFGTYNLYTINENQKQKKEDKQFVQNLSFSMPDTVLAYDIVMDISVPDKWETVGTPVAYEWKYDFKPILRYSEEYVTKVDISYKLSRSFKRIIDKEIEDFTFNVELALNEKKHEFKKVNKSIAIAKAEKDGYTRLYGIVKSDIPTNQNDALSGYYYAYIIADVYDNRLGEKEFTEILQTVKFNMNAHKNTLWFDKYLISRLAFEFDETESFIHRGKKSYKKSYSIDDSEVSSIVRRIVTMHSEKTLTTAQMLEYTQKSQFVSVAGYKKDDDDNYDLAIIIEFYDSGLVCIKDCCEPDVEQYYYSSDAKQLYKEIKMFKEKA